MPKIVAHKTYSSNEAAEALGMNINTFQKLAREGKIITFRAGKNYRVTGLTLLEFMGIPAPQEKKVLLDQFYESLEKLSPLLREENKDMGVFLTQSIAMNTDVDALNKIILDINHYLELSDPERKGIA